MALLGSTVTVHYDLPVRVADAEIDAFVREALRLLVGDTARSLPQVGYSQTTTDGDSRVSYRLGNEQVGLSVRDERYVIDAGGINNRFNGDLLAFVGYGLPPSCGVSIERERDARERERVRVSFTADPGLAQVLEEAFLRDIARMSRGEVDALVALGGVPSLPESTGFELPSRALDWELAPVDPKHADLVVAARDALASVATDAPRWFWLGVLDLQLGALDAAAQALLRAHAAAPASEPIALAAGRVLLDLGRNREALALLSAHAPASEGAQRSELLLVALLRAGRPAEALSALAGRPGLERARLLDATGDRDGAVRELRRAFLLRPDQGCLFQAGAAGPTSLLARAAPGSRLSALIDEEWILAMWADPRVARILRADFTHNVQGYHALLAVADLPPFADDLDFTAGVAPGAVDLATRSTTVGPAKLEEAFRLLGGLWGKQCPFPGIRLRMALLSAMLGRREDALRIFEEVLAGWPRDAAAARGREIYALSPEISRHGVTYAATPLPRTETFVITARSSSHLDWEQRVQVPITADRVRLELEEEAHRLTLEIDGEHPKGGWITERVFIDPGRGEVLGRESLAR